MKEEEHNAFRKWSKFLKCTDTKNTPTMNRFQARYQFSRKYKGINADLKEDTLNGYSKIFHVFLAHSAFDALVKGADELAKREKSPIFVDLKMDKNNHLMINDEITNELLKVEGMGELLIAYADNEIRIARLKAFYNIEYTEDELQNVKLMKVRETVQNSNNLLVVASAIRNLVAHGQLSATGANAVTKKNARAIENLAKFVEFKTIELFGQYVDLLFEKYVSAK
jgi:hypothetical protein